MDLDKQKQLFAQWLRKTRSLSASTLNSYTEGVLLKIQKIIDLSSNERVKMLNPNMYLYQTISDFNNFVSILKNDPNFDIVNKTGQPQSGWVSTPLKHYKSFLIQNGNKIAENDDISSDSEKMISYFARDKNFNDKEFENMNISLNQILYGPPGTGKTYNAVLKAMSIINNAQYKDVSKQQYEELKKDFDEHKKEGQIEFVTFHQSYSYEEFVEGIKPNLNGDNLSYKLENGIFKNICTKANSNPNNNYVLIIDEINRGNISKIFGELITLIEEDKRENLSLTLPYSKETFGIPKNLYIIGTMNTSDRSIASIDIALRRRFKFIEMMPKKELVADFEIGFGNIFEELNNKIKILLDRDHQIGHSYFIKTKYENANVNVLKAIWFSEIIPLLNEYFYCDWEKLKLIIPGFINKTEVPESFQNECDEFSYEFKTFDEIMDFEAALKQENFERVF